MHKASEAITKSFLANKSVKGFNFTAVCVTAMQNLHISEIYTVEREVVAWLHAYDNHTASVQKLVTKAGQEVIDTMHAKRKARRIAKNKGACKYVTRAWVRTQEVKKNMVKMAR